MREDFYEVVTSAGREGGYPNRKTGLSLRHVDEQRIEKIDALPTRDKMCQHYRRGQCETKNRESAFLNGPIERFLMSRRGKLWNDIAREISQVFPMHSHRRELIDHILGPTSFTVEKNCVIIEGVVWDSLRRYRVTKFYVHPVRGTLEYIPLEGSHNSKPFTVGEGLQVLNVGAFPKYMYHDKDNGTNWDGAHLVCKLDDLTRVVRESGIWFKYQYRERTQHERRVVHKNQFGTKVTEEIEILPRLALVRKKQLSRSELRKFGLKNDVEEVA